VTAGSLQGSGVLVTRPEHQAAELTQAILDAGGKAISFPVIDIAPLEDSEINHCLADLPVPDIIIFVSSNAVNHGWRFVEDLNAQLAAVGPATAAALSSLGRPVDITPNEGFDSEHLLAEKALTDVAGKNIWIVRGEDGRELLAETLRERGATVSYLAVYGRQPTVFSDSQLTALERDWLAGHVNLVTAMSVASLDNLVRLLPTRCRESLRQLPLVSPSNRVLQRASELGVGNPLFLSDGPGASAMIKALLACHEEVSGKEL
jgi:uroporphyrinogen-III synthase